MINKRDLIVIRNINPVKDHSFIMATLLRGLYYGDSWFSEIKKSVFMTTYHGVGEAMLSTPGMTVKVACLRDEPDAILGYCIYSKHILNYIFIKRAWRNIGLATMLLPAGITQVSHLTKTGLAITRKKNWDFNPFVFS